MSDHTHLIIELRALHNVWSPLMERHPSWSDPGLLAALLNAANALEAAGAENKRLTAALAGAREALKNIARQKLRAEMDEETQDNGDFEGAYDTMIEVARYALPATEPAKAENK